MHRRKLTFDLLILGYSREEVHG
jgi:hypothetical protein